MSTFISDFMHHTKDYESPTVFWQWSAYSTIGAVLRDNCFKTRGDSFLYPNIYVLLLADSSGHRKGNPIDMCEMLVNSVNNTRAIGGSTSIQALVDELAHAETDSKTGKLKKAGAGIFIAQEFSAALVEDPRAVKILTDVYDYKPCGYSVKLISRASTKIDKLVLSMFTASNQAMLKGFFENTAIYGGFLARTFLIMPTDFRPSNPLWDDEESIVRRKKSFSNLISRLTEIVQLKGEFIFEKEAQEIYNKWYIPFRKSYFTKPDKTGVTGRIHTSIIKISMILAANDLTLTVTPTHMQEAIDVCTALLPNYRRFTLTSGGNSTVKEAGEIVLSEMASATDNMVSRKCLLQNHWNEFDGEILDKLIVTLQGGGLVTEITQMERGKVETYYVMTEKCKEIMIGKAAGGIQ